MKFRVSPEMFPGVYREGVGFFRVGEDLSLPDSASSVDADGKLLEPPPYQLEPLDAEADTALQQFHGKGPHAAKLKRFGSSPSKEASPKKKSDDRLTMAEASKLHGKG